jgi:teichuronic acid biosynthesis glycosyltransferase TuaC
MSRRNIALTVISESVGGAEAVVKQIGRHIDKSKYDCLIITNDEIQDYYREAGLTTVSVGAFHRWPSFTVLNRAARKIEARLPALALARLRRKVHHLSKFIREYRIDLLHSHLLPDTYLASLLVPRTVTRVMTIHGGLGLDVKMPCLLAKDEVIAMMDRADFVTSACRYLLDLLRDHGMDIGGRCAIIENGTDAGTCGEGVPPLRPIDILPARSHDGVLRMVFLGGARYVKGGDLLARALSIVVNERRLTNVRLAILRDISRRSEMYRCLRENGLSKLVDFAGYVRNESHLDYIRRSDLYVLPSRSEGVANTLMEAIGLGKAILATDVGGTSEVVSHGVNGYLCQPSPESIAEGIAYFLQNPAQLAEFGRKNVELRSRFFWPGIVAKYESLYEKLLSGHR